MTIQSPAQGKVGELTRFAEHLDLHHRIEGWFSEESAAIWDALLCFQEHRRVRGHMLEIGVWKGKSAALLALHHDPQSEVCVLVDNQFDQAAVEAALAQVCPDGTGSFQLLEADSRKLLRDTMIVDAFESFRWIHIDGEHTARAVMNDLEVANGLLADDGIVCVDDYFNWLYPQVTEAVNRYVRERPDDFALVLCGYNKAYLARPHHAHEWLAFCKDRLMGELEARHVHATLAKSTLPSEMNTFGIGPRFNDQPLRGPDWDQDTIRI